MRVELPLRAWLGGPSAEPRPGGCGCGGGLRAGGWGRGFQCPQCRCELRRGGPLAPLPSVLLGLSPSLGASSLGAGAQGSLRRGWGPGPGLGASFLTAVGAGHPPSEGMGLRLPSLHPLRGFASAAGVGLRGRAAEGGPGAGGQGGRHMSLCCLLPAAGRPPAPHPGCREPLSEGSGMGAECGLGPPPPKYLAGRGDRVLSSCESIKCTLMGLVTHRRLAPWGGWGLRASVSGKREGVGCRALGDVDHQAGLWVVGPLGAGWPSVC